MPFDSQYQIPLHYLFEVLDVSNICQLFWCVLTEQRVLFVSDQYTLLTYIAESVVSLLFPFKWHQVYVPILPECLLEFMGSPTPFIMGAHTSYYHFEPHHPLTAEVIPPPHTTNNSNSNTINNSHTI